MKKKLIFLAISPFFLGSSILQGNVIAVPVVSSTLSSYQRFIQAEKIDDNKPLTNLFKKVDAFSAPSLSRGVIDLLIFKEALRLSGFNKIFRFVSVPNGKRMRQMLTSARALSSGTIMWSIHKTKDTQISSPVFRNGEYFKGIYMAKDNLSYLEKFPDKALKDLPFVPVTVDSWKTDIKTMKSIFPKGIETAPTKDVLMNLLFKKVQKQDPIIYFSLLEFSRAEGFSLKINRGQREKELIAVPEVKVSLRGEMGFMLSKNHSEFASFKSALNEGLRILRQNGNMKKAYELGGVINAKVDGWRVLH